MDVSANVFNKLSMLSAKKWDSVKFATYKKYNLFYGVKRGFTWWSGYYRHLTQLSFILYNSNRTVDCCCNDRSTSDNKSNLPVNSNRLSSILIWYVI